jgi:hypothetical protein
MTTMRTAPSKIATEIDPNTASEVARIVRRQFRRIFDSVAEDFSQQPSTDNYLALQEMMLDWQHICLNLSNRELAHLYDRNAASNLRTLARESRIALHSRLDSRLAELKK